MMRRFLAAFFVGLIVSVGGNKTATWLDKRAKVRLHGPTTSLHHWPTLNMQLTQNFAPYASTRICELTAVCRPHHSGRAYLPARSSLVQFTALGTVFFQHALCQTRPFGTQRTLASWVSCGIFRMVRVPAAHCSARQHAFGPTRVGEGGGNWCGGGCACSQR